MFVFQNHSSRGQQFLYVSKEEGSKALMLQVFDPVIGQFSARWSSTVYPIHPLRWTYFSNKDIVNSAGLASQEALCLNSSIHFKDDNSEKFTLLGDRIYSREASWEGSLPTLGEISHTPGYWEWTEDILKLNKGVLDMARLYNAIHASLFTYDVDKHVLQDFFELWCPATNSLHTSAGEMSISLWDLRAIGGLPIQGLFYDEVIPSERELTGRNKDNELYLSSCCKYLFQAYHLIYYKNSRRVTTFEWVKFWFKGDIRYPKPPGRTSRKHLSKPRKSNNPSGIIGESFSRSAAQDQVFKDLGVDDDAVEETYLAAMLSCWLCKFVLPADEVDIVRPGVFKVASLMARGERFSLAVPVLASIYRSLRNISSSLSPGKRNDIFPIHYVYGWLGQYFDTYWPTNSSIRGARMVRMAGERNAKYFTRQEDVDHLLNVKHTMLSSLSLHKSERESIIDTDRQSSTSSEYLISIRSSYLTLRRNSEITVESYSPYRFARQFNFCQDMPGKLKKEIRTCPLDEMVQLWHSCSRLCTGAKFEIPISTGDVLSTRDYAEWWRKCASNFIRTREVTQASGHEAKGKSNNVKGNNSQCKPTHDPIITDTTKAPGPKIPSVIIKVPKIPQVIKELGLISSEESDSDGKDINPKRRKKAHHSPTRKSVKFVGTVMDRPISPASSPSSSTCSVDGPSSYDVLLNSCKGDPPTSPLMVEELKHASNSETDKSCTLVREEIEPSILHADELLDSYTREFVSKLWGEVKGKIEKRPFHLLTPLKVEVTKILDRMASVGAPNVLPLRSLVNKFFQNIESYQLACAKDVGVSESPSRYVEEANLLLSTAEQAQVERNNTISSLFGKLKDIDSQVTNVRSQLSNLLAQEKEIKGLLSQEEWKLSEVQGEIASIQEAIVTFRTTSHHSTELKELGTLLERSKDELINFRLFP